MKTVIFVPGFRENLLSRNYAGAIATIEFGGYKVVFVQINWHKTTLTDWVKQIGEVYNNFEPAQTILAGFSFGALTSLVVAANRVPCELWLFSLSPYFADDLLGFKKSWLKDIGHRREAVFKTMNFGAITRKISCKTILLYGSIEAKKYPLIARRAQLTCQAIDNCTSYCIDGADHDVGDPNYIKAIRQTIIQ